MKVLIFNSGIGSRMNELTKDKPKCLVKLYNGETILERQIRILSEAGLKDFIITVGPYKEKIYQITDKYSMLNFTFVENLDYKNTNYIVSMNNASRYLNDDILLMHGDLVFNKNLIRKILEDERKSICLYNEKKKLPDKDFKGRFKDNILKEVSISIFDKNCFTFQPLYKLRAEDIRVWKDKVAEYVKKGNTKVYAENALNDITNEILIYGMSYKNDYIEEIDNKEDYDRVSNEIKYWDYREQEIENIPYSEALNKYLNKNEEIFIVTSKRFSSSILDILKSYNFTIFCEYSSNPKYEEIRNGVKLFKKKKYSKIISIGGGSTIDVAKCIKIFSTMKNEEDFLKKDFGYSNIKHIAIPTTAGTGSESTNFAVMYYNEKKMSIEHGSILPDLVVLDENLLKTLSDYQKKATLLDSLCQGIESYWSKMATIESKKYAEMCIKLILNNYEKYIEDNDEFSRKNMLIASNYSGKAINISKTTSAHAMSYKITTKYGISHGHAVALCLIPIWKKLLEKSYENIELKQTLFQIANIFECENISKSIEKFFGIVKKCNLPKIQINKDDIQILVKSINIERMKNNPIDFSEEEIGIIYKSI